MPLRVHAAAVVQGDAWTDGDAQTGRLSRRRARLITELSYRVGDMLAVAIAAIAVRAAFLPYDARAFGGLLPLVLAVVATHVVFTTRGHYRTNPVLQPRLGVLQLLVAWLHAFGLWLVAVVILSALPSMTIARDIGWPFSAALPAPWLAHAGPAAFLLAGGVFIVTVRLALRHVFTLVPLAEQVRLRAAVVGSIEEVSRFAASLPGTPAMRIEGYYDAGLAGDGGGARLPAGMPRRGDFDTLSERAGRGLVDMVLVAMPMSQMAEVEDIVRRLARLPVSVALVGVTPEFRFPRKAEATIDGIDAVQICEPRLSEWATLVKTVEDMVLAPLLLVLTAPVMLAAAIAIRLDSPGPILFRQRRHGLGNSVFTVYKFRTMRVDQTDADCERQTERGDPRITRVGGVLRRLSIDELPQLFNVLRGEMSIVGPRPHALSTKADGQLYEDAVATYMARHHVKPGITGWAQVNGWRGETDTLAKIRKRVEHDLHYIGNWSLALDIVIILRTVGNIWHDENAF